jgi:hypothetical protein
MPPSDARQPYAVGFATLGEGRCVSELNVERAARAPGGVGHRVARLGALQHGQAAGWQLRALGVSERGILRRCAGGYLHRTHHSTFSIGCGPTTRLGLLMGAVLACGPGSGLAGPSAGELLQIWRPDRTEPIHIAVSGPGGRGRPGLRIHRNTLLDARDCMLVAGIPTTVAPRTLMDMAPWVGPQLLDSLVGRAYRRELLDSSGLRSLLARCRGRRGVGMLRLATEELWMDPEKLRSLLEARMLRLCRLHPTAPDPLVNRNLRVGGRTYETDFRWPAQRLIIETDGFAFHGDPRSHERDRQRDQDLQLRGWRVYRFTWRHVTRESWRVQRVLDHYFRPS